ncbi:MAG: sensor histidine kinase [Arcobacteraceae bacterium]
MLHSEKKTITNVLILYLFSTFLLVSMVAFAYFRYEAEIYKNQIKSMSTKKAEQLHIELEKLHKSSDSELTYPRYSDFESAIYDSNKNLIFSTEANHKKIDFSKELYKEDGFVYFIYSAKPYYLGAKYIVLKQKNISVFKNIGINILLLTLIVLFIIGLTSIFLVKLILKPLRENVNILDKFIKDTTHELNTPVSTILTNIEMIEQLPLDINMKTKLNRIKIASQSISNLYEDLVYITLNHNIQKKNEYVEISKIIEDRIEYFTLMFNSKNIEIVFENNGSMKLFIDKSNITRVVDNLLSNAYKYSKKNSVLKITSTEQLFKICDEGIGMDQSEIARIFERYTRFDTTVGGFGIGYNIIHSIINEYKLNIQINSQKGVGTCITIKK